jgi:hypothetical protein
MDALMRAVIEGARQEMRKSYVSPTYMGLHFAAIGEADSAMAWFEKAYETHAYPLSLVAVNWDCKPIRNDPRFIDLLDRLGLEDVKPAYARD